MIVVIFRVFSVFSLFITTLGCSKGPLNEVAKNTTNLSQSSSHLTKESLASASGLWTEHSAIAPVIDFDSSVSSDYRSSINNDLFILSHLNLPSQDTYGAFGVSDFSNTSTTKWLRERMKVIVGENYSVLSNASLFKKHYTGIPSPVGELALASDTIVSRMDNIGGGIYLAGKKAHVIISLNIKGKTIPIRSPRIGIFQIGSGYFDNSLTQNYSQNSFLRSLIRLSTLFHESRHDDGNGTHATFPHTLCTAGDYIKEYACEDHLNGAYSIQATVLNKFYAACAHCTETEKEILKTLLADLRSRIQIGATLKDEKPEQMR